MRETGLTSQSIVITSSSWLQHALNPAHHPHPHHPHHRRYSCSIQSSISGSPTASFRSKRSRFAASSSLRLEQSRHLVNGNEKHGSAHRGRSVISPSAFDVTWVFGFGSVDGSLGCLNPPAATPPLNLPVCAEGTYSSHLTDGTARHHLPVFGVTRALTHDASGRRRGPAILSDRLRKL